MGVSIRTLAFACAAVAGAAMAQAAQAGVIYSDFGRNIQYSQTDATTVVPDNGGVNAFVFGRNFYANASDFDGGEMTGAATSPLPFTFTGFTGMGGYQSGYLTPADMDANFPVGTTYGLTSTNSVTSDSQTANVFYDHDIFTGDVPILDAGSFNALQGAAPHVGQTVGFNSFTPDAGADRATTYFNIYDYTASASVFDGNGPSSTTGFFVPGSVFKAGHSYSFLLIFDDEMLGTDANSGLGFSARSDMRTVGTFSVAAVPEPATWSMMILGLGLAGAALRRRKSAIA